MYALCKRRSNYLAMMFKKILVPKTKCTASTFGTFFGIFDVKKYHSPVCTWMSIFHVIERQSHPVKNTLIHICSVILMYYRQHLSLNVEMSVAYRYCRLSAPTGRSVIYLMHETNR